MNTDVDSADDEAFCLNHTDYLYDWCGSYLTKWIDRGFPMVVNVSTWTTDQNGRHHHERTAEYLKDVHQIEKTCLLGIEFNWEFLVANTERRVWLFSNSHSDGWTLLNGIFAFVGLAMLGNIISLTVFIRAARKIDLFYVHQVSLCIMDVGGMFMTLTYGVVGLFVYPPASNVFCWSPVSIYTAKVIEQLAMGLNLTAFLLFGLSSWEWQDALRSDLKTYRGLNHPKRAVFINAVGYGLSFFFAFTLTKGSTEWIDGFRTDETLAYEASCSLMLYGKEKEWTPKAIYQKFVGPRNFTGLYIEVLNRWPRDLELLSTLCFTVSATTLQRNVYLAVVVCSYVMLVGQMGHIFVLYVRLRRRHAKQGTKIEPELKSITEFFFFEFSLSVFNFFAVVSTLTFYAGNHLMEELVQMVTFLIQVSFNFIFFLLTSDMFRFELAKILRTLVSPLVTVWRMVTGTTKKPLTVAKNGSSENKDNGGENDNIGKTEMTKTSNSDIGKEAECVGKLFQRSSAGVFKTRREISGNQAGGNAAEDMVVEDEPHQQMQASVIKNDLVSLKSESSCEIEVEAAADIHGKNKPSIGGFEANTDKGKTICVTSLSGETEWS